MAFLTINTTELPTPSAFEVTIQDFDSSESNRNSQGQLFRDRICVKYKLSVTWRVLDAEQMSMILNAISPIFFNVTFFDPKLNDYRTTTMYTGDRTPTLYTFREDGTVIYDDFTISLIER